MINQILHHAATKNNNLPMNIALCLYGHFRCFDACWPELKHNLIDPNDIKDVFGFSWGDSMGYFLHPEQSNDHKKHPGYDQSSGPPSDIYIRSVVDRLSPKKLVLRDYHDLDQPFDSMVASLSRWHHPSHNHRPKGTIGQVFGRCEAINAMRAHSQETGVRYDMVVVTRWDIAHSSPIDIRSLDQDTVAMDGMYGPDVISDAWACGPQDLIERWGLQFSGIDRLVDRGTMNLGPHEWLKAWFSESAISWKNRPEIGIWIRR